MGEAEKSRNWVVQFMVFVPVCGDIVELGSEIVDVEEYAQIMSRTKADALHTKVLAFRADHTLVQCRWATLIGS